MTANSILLVKMLSDIALTALTTIRKVDAMSEDQIDAEIAKAEKVSKVLLDELVDH